MINEENYIFSDGMLCFREGLTVIPIDSYPEETKTMVIPS